MDEWIDRPRKVRPGEELDLPQLQAYLQSALGETGELTLHQFPSGYSNLTYLLSLGSRELVLRRPPFGSKVKSAHDMGREYHLLAKLHPIYPLAPRPLIYCQEEEPLGAPFYVMERIKGIILRKDLPNGLNLDTEQMQELCEKFLENLVRLHALDWQAAGLGELGKPEGYVQRQVEGWIKRYHGSQTGEVPLVEQVTQWLTQNQPAESGVTLIHNDYKLDNIVLDSDQPTRIIGVLDWEMSTIGDPLMDLGTTLSYWVNREDPPALQMTRMLPTHLPGCFTRQELVARYLEKTQRPGGQIVFYYAFGLFKLAVIAQQIYYRYAKGLTQDARFASLGEVVKILVKSAAKAIENDQI